MAKQNKRIDIFKGRTKEYDYDYYDRPSLKTAYTLAVIGLCGIVIILIGVGILNLIGAA